MREDNAVIRLLWALSAHIRYLLRRCMPTNILLDLIRSRRGLKWGVPAMLLSAGREFENRPGRPAPWWMFTPAT